MDRNNMIEGGKMMDRGGMTDRGAGGGLVLGYNTNGLAHHDLFDAVEVLAEIGYRGVAITIDHNALPPYGRNASQRVTRLRRLLERLGLRSVIETGARFLLDPRRKHEPTLLSANRRARIDFYKYAIDVAAQLRSQCVSLWSGVLHEPLSRDQAIERLAEGLAEVLDYAAQQSVEVGFEPEPRMLIDSMSAFEQLLERPGIGKLRLTLDIGHLQCQGESPINSVIRRWASRLVNVHIEDMRAGIHEHLPFGEGEIAFPPVFRALAEVGYPGGVYVELSRHSHEGPETAKKAFMFLESVAKESGSLLISPM
jgi:sugar phosphate isomerase/epimerase